MVFTRGHYAGRFVRLGVQILLGSVLSVNAATPASMQMTDLGTLPGDSDSRALAVNNAGQVVGYSNTPNGIVRAVLWDRGRITNLGTLGGTYSIATAISNQAHAAGFSADATGAVHAFLWAEGRMVDLGTLGGWYSSASATNDRGQIAGNSATSTGEIHGVIWDKGTIRDLGIQSQFVAATDINNKGQVVGFYQTPSGQPHAFLWQGGHLTDLGTLGGTFSYAYGISDRGEVTGMSADTFGNIHAFLWRDGVMRDLHGIAGFGASEQSEARGISDSGKVAGSVGLGSKRAFIWDGRGAVILDTLGGSDSLGLAVNNGGTVVGTSSVSTQTFAVHAFIAR